MTGGMSVLELLLEGKPREEILAHSTEQIRRLVESDRATGSEYVKTLRCFLECGNDLLHASKKLYIHRNTMINRMKKINALLEVNMNEPETRNEYCNVFRVLDYYRERQK